VRGWSKSVAVVGALAAVGVPCVSGLPVLAQVTTPVVGPPQAGSAVTYRVSWKTTQDGSDAGSGAVIVAMRWRTGDKVVASIALAETPTSTSVYVLTRAADGLFTLDHLSVNDADGTRLASAVGILNDVTHVLAVRPAGAPRWTLTMPFLPQVLNPPTPVAPVDLALTATEATADGDLVLTASGSVTVQPSGSRAARLLQRLSGEGEQPMKIVGEIHGRFAPDGAMETASLVETTTSGSDKESSVLGATWQVARVP
jgi:hypothetical protein